MKQNNKKAKPKATKIQKLTNSLTHLKSELVVSYSKFPCEQLKFVAKPTILTVKENLLFPSNYNAASTAYAWKIVAPLCWWWQRQLAPCRFTYHLGSHITTAQHTPLVV
jgi:hypothetical protein